MSRKKERVDMWTRRAKFILVISVLLFVFNACSFSLTGGQKEDVLEPGFGKGTDGARENTGADKTEKLKYTMNMLNIEIAGKDANGEPTANFKYFCDKFNVEFEFWPVNWTDWQEKTRVWIFSGDMPDILFMDLAPARFNEYSRTAKQGAYRALPDFSGKYPNLQRYKESIISTKYLTINGSLYALPKTRDAAEFNNASYWQYIYRRDWARKLGLAKEDNIYTWEEWLALNKAFVDMDPGGNGKGKTIGMGAPEWALPKFMGGGCINPYFCTYALQDGKYVWGPTMPESLELVKVFKQMYDDGIIWKDMLLGKGLDSENKYIAGLMGAKPMSAPVYKLAGFRRNFENMNPGVEDVEEATQLALVRDKSGKLYADQTEDYWSVICFSQKISDEKFDRILEAYDWLASDEGYDFRTLGIPGVDWERKDGETRLKWTENADGTLSYPYSVDGEYWMGIGLEEGFDLYSPVFTPSIRKEVLDIQKRKLAPDSNLVPFDYEVMFFSGPEYDRVGTMEAEIVDKLCDLLIHSGDIEKDWLAWLKSMESRYGPVEDELNRLLAPK